MFSIWRTSVKTLKFEARQIALKKDKDGFAVTFRVHPDDIPMELIRDFVGAVYDCELTRTDSEHIDKQAEYTGKLYVKLAGILCSASQFWDFLYADSQIIRKDEKAAIEWMHNYLGVKSRAELPDNIEAQQLLDKINREFKQWMQKTK